MNLRERVLDLDGRQAIEVTYLIFRYLTHRLDDQSFRKLFLAEATSAERERSYDIALAAVHDIEKNENKKIGSLPVATLEGYIQRLAAVANEMRPVASDDLLQAAAERELEIFRSH